MQRPVLELSAVVARKQLIEMILLQLQLRQLLRLLQQAQCVECLQILQPFIVGSEIVAAVVTARLTVAISISEGRSSL